MSLSRRSRIAWTLAVAQVVITAPAVMTTPALAQVGAAVLTGRVVDATNQAPIGDVVVTVTSPALQGEQMAVTDASGAYRLPALPSGEYVVRVEKDSYRPYSRSGIALRADATIRFDAQLLPEAVKGEEVEVRALAPTVDVGSTNVGLNINREAIRRVPISPPSGKGGGSKSFETVAAVAPGANTDMFGTSINGASSPENSYLIDGVSANSPTQGTLSIPLSYEFMGEVNVITAGYMPEYGRSTGGIVNAVTKSGGNEFHGGVWGDLTPGGLASNPKPVVNLSTIQLSRKVNNIWDIGFDAGGPIQKDKLWFYVGFQYSRTVYDLRRTLNRTLTATNTYEEIPGTETIYPAANKEYQAIGKLTYSINQHHKLVLSLNATPSRSGGKKGDVEEFSINPDTGFPDFAYLRGSSPQGTYSAMANQTIIDSFGAVLNYTADFDNKHVLWDTTVGWRNQYIGNHAVDGSGPTDNQNPNTIAGTPFVIFRRNTPAQHSILDFSQYERPFDPSLCAPPNYSCDVPLYVAGGPGLALGLVDRYINRYQFKSVLTYFGEAAGHHVIKGGLDSEFLTWRNVRGWPGGRRYRESTDGATFDDYRAYGFLRSPDDAVVLNNLDFTTKSLLVGGFVQDSWSIMDKVTVNIGSRYDAQLLYGPDGALGLALPNQWSPRIGVIYDPTQSGRMKVYGNYARLYESVPLDIADRSLSGEPGLSATYACNPLDPATRGACGTDAARLRYRNATTASPDKKWFTTGAGLTPIDPDIKPQSSDEIVVGAQYDIIDNMRAGIDYTRRWLNYVIEDMSRDEAQTYFLGNPGYGIASDFPKATRNYDAVMFSLHRAFSENWQADFSYTLSWLRGNIAGLFRPESGQLDPNINSDFDLRSMMANRQGPLANDKRHQLKAFGSYEFALASDMRLNLGGVIQARSGDPSNYLGAHPIYGSNEAYLLPRGSGERLPWTFSMDTRVAYSFRFTKTNAVEVTLDIFNLLNFQSEISRDQTYTNSDVLPIENGTPADLPGKLRHASNSDPFTTNEVNKAFGLPTAYQVPRYFKFGLRTTF